MSNKYKAGDNIPSEVLCKRLDELSNAVTKGQYGMREFDMRIPAELDRDADIVLMLASKRIKELEARLYELRPRLPDTFFTLGNWRHSNGIIFCGSLRIAIRDFDTNPSEKVAKECFDWVCETLNNNNKF
ncbi:MAG: hypothetical protein OEY89_17985 [Gammaproteobacteria bacterium]|nr:hypothetical protein [Gammaproteobacteria bacterium]